MKQIFFSLLVVILSIGSFGCAKKKEPQYAGVDGDFINATPLSERVEGTNFYGENVHRGQYPPIYFRFDSFTIAEAELEKVRRLAADLKRSSQMVIVAGFTDSRGTEEYNRALGERRANAVRQALIRLGIKSERLQTVSFGMERPADPGSGEAAWAKNRRAEIGLVK
ncbi:MAG: peptidoglycan-associated lipoprotein [Verrucomicrobia bacterium]|nr:MAG: peptidoglycan-associated lipoprotein [Verrucomicrobiota bacterium]